jgi:hypothetical protein
MKQVFPRFLNPTSPWALLEFVESRVGELECPLLLASRDEEELNLLLLLLLLKASFVELRERVS